MIVKVRAGDACESSLLINPPLLLIPATPSPHHDLFANEQQLFSVLGTPSRQELREMKLDRKPAMSLRPLGEIRGSGLTAHLQQMSQQTQRQCQRGTFMEPSVVSILTGFWSVDILSTSTVMFVSESTFR
jgi:hypothetical protein